MRPPEDGPGPDHLPDEDTPPAWLPGQHLPSDARRMGLSPLVPDGALIEFAASLDSTKWLHRMTAWVLLGIFGAPVVLSALQLLRDGLG